MTPQNRLNEDILFLACTRPAMIAGVTYGAWAVIAMGTLLFFLIGGSLIYLLCGVFGYSICRLICKNNPNQFELITSWLDTKFRCPTRFFWKAVSCSPLRLHKPTNRFRFRQVEL